MRYTDNVWAPERPQETENEVLKLYVGVLVNGGPERPKAMNAPKMEGEHISGSKPGERAKYATN